VTRDPPRSRTPRPEFGREGRDPTQSLEIGPDEARPSHPSLATGTAEPREERTKLESPSARSEPQRAVSKPPRDALAEEPKDRLGETLGVYRLLELLGKGGMGYVYRAEHVKLGREVALKLLRSDYARRRDAVLRFFQEAKTVNRVRHRNIVDVTDFVELDDGTTFIIMEFLRGQSLGRWARTGIDLPRALAVLVQICDGLGAAHAVGVIHRDLKPDNVIVVPTSDGAELVKLLDFGVAKLVNREDEDVGFQTAAGSVIGTPAYMSPEQAGGMVVDHRSDIYSLGAIMYELFCGQPMFRGRSFGEYVRKHLTEVPMLPHQTQGGANIDPRLEALILRCLAKDPNERFGHILELRDGLLHMLGGIETVPPQYASPQAVMPTQQLAMGQLPPHMLPLPAPAITTIPTPQSDAQVMPLMSSSLLQQYSGYTPQPTQAPKSTWWVWFAGGALAVALGISGAVWYARRGAEAQAPAPAPAVTPAIAMSATPAEPTPQTKLLELRFDSLPKAGVFVEGHSAELCRTPCSFNVNLADGGPTDKRTFVVRADGYRDKPVVVDLASAQRDYSVTLDQNEAPAADEPVRASKTKSKKTVAKKQPAEKQHEEVKQPEPDKPPPEPKKKPETGIDPTDTVDPFHSK
jgi:serine/threonine protein kinase